MEGLTGAFFLGMRTNPAEDPFAALPESFGSSESSSKLYFELKKAACL